MCRAAHRHSCVPRSLGHKSRSKKKLHSEITIPSVGCVPNQSPLPANAISSHCMIAWQAHPHHIRVRPLRGRRDTPNRTQYGAHKSRTAYPYAVRRKSNIRPIRGPQPTSPASRSSNRLLAGNNEIRISDDSHFRAVEPFDLNFLAHADRNDEIAEFEPRVGHDESEDTQNRRVEQLGIKL